MKTSKTLVNAAAAALALSAPAAHAQQQPKSQAAPPACAVKRDAAPELRGFRLGMTEAQVRERIPGASVQRDPLGLGSVSFAHGQLHALDPAAYAGVVYITLLFIDDRVTSVSAQYDQTIGWKSPEQFAERVSDLLRLPKGWRQAEQPQQQGEHPYAPGLQPLTMKCDGFQVIVYPNFIRVLDAEHEPALARRREEFEDRKRQTFKP